MQNLEYEKICSGIRKQIIDRLIPPGTKLSTSKLARDWNVSRTPVREALRLLESEGLIDYVPQKGFKVNRITIEDVDKIYAIRTYNEGLAGKLSTPIIVKDGKKLKLLEDLCNSMEINSNERNIEEYIQANKKFHQIIVNSCGNEWLIKILEFLNSHINRFVVKAIHIPNHFEKSVREHWKIYFELKKGREMGVEKAIREHLLRASNDLRREIMRES